MERFRKSKEEVFEPETSEELLEAKIVAGVTSEKEAKKRGKRAEKVFSKLEKAKSMKEGSKAIKELKELEKHPAYKALMEGLKEESTRAEYDPYKVIENLRCFVKEVQENEDLADNVTALSKGIDILTKDEVEREMFTEKFSKSLENREKMGAMLHYLVFLGNATKEFNKAKKIAGVKSQQDLLKENIKTIERREEMPFKADLRVDFVRHGMPEYSKEEMKSGKLEGKLTEKGIEGVHESAKNLAEGIDKEKELVVIWKSPKGRAQETAAIIEKVFEENGITVLKKLDRKSLSDIKITGEFIEHLMKNKIVEMLKYWAESEELPEGVETPAEAKKRSERLVTYLERIARTIQPPEGKKLHFICVGHEETVRNLLEEAYGVGTKKGTGPTYAEAVRMDINKSEGEKDAVLELSYDGYPNAELGFHKEERKFYKRELVQN